MRRGTTPTLTFIVPEEVIDCDILSIAFAQNGKLIFEKNLEDVTIEENKFICPLSEEDTLKFDSRYTVLIQLRVGKRGARLASNIIKTTATVILKDGVL